MNLAELQKVLDKLCAEEPLEVHHRDHAPMGDYTGFRERRIRSDWLLICAVDTGRPIPIASRTGTHSGLSGE